jgi:glutathione-regulated potassium-efflux system protein KefB
MHGGGLELALVFLLAAVIAVPLFKRFGLGAVLGYLVAGVALGPNGLAVVRDAEGVLTASEIGVVMLLFVIGLELSLPRLKVMRQPVFVVGGLQVLLCGLALGALALASGLGPKTALIVGLGLALSSTAVGLQLLAERKALNTDYGRLGFAILLFQDLAAIPLLAVIPLLGTVVAADAGTPTWLAISKGLGAMALLVIGGRVLLRHVFRIIARTGMPEVFTATALLVVLGSAWLMQAAGLSAGLGAFLAGVLLADSEFRHELESQIQPFEGLLLGLFFMAVGMSIDLRQVAAEPAMIAAGVAALMAVKFALLFALGLKPGGLGRRESLLLASVLALGGEFAFVVFSEAGKAGLLDAATRDRLVAIVGISMALTPLLLIAMLRLAGAAGAAKPKRPYDAIHDDHPQVLIAGFGRFGQIVARLLLAQRVPFVAIEHDAEQVDFVRRFGNKIYYGDPARPDLLRAAGAANVRVFVIAVDTVESSLRTVRVIRRHYPDAKVFARARDRRHAWQLMDLGATVMRETFVSSLEMGRDVLVALGMAPDVAAEHAQRFREHDERLLASQYLVHDDEDALRQTAADARAELEQLFEADRGDATGSETATPSR